MKVHQVYQLHPTETKNPMFRACLFVVSEVKPWGAQGYVQSLGEGGLEGGQAYYRATHEELVELDEGSIAPYVIGSGE